jgi:phage baseplate assembly protein V
MKEFAEFANAVRQQAQMSGNGMAWPRLATISSYDASNHAVKVTVQPVDPAVGPIDSNWMPLGAIGIGNGWGVAVGPQIGDQVMVVYEGGDFSSGTIVARIFSVAQQAPAVPSGEIWAVHQAGAFLKFHNDGTVALSAPSTITYTAAQHHFVGPVLMDNTLTGNGGIAISGDNGTGNASTVNGNFNTTGTITNNGHDIGSTHKHINSGGSGLGGVPQ